MPGPLGTTPATQSMAFEGEGAGGPPPSNAVYVSGTTWVITGNTWITGDTTVANQMKFNIVDGSIGTTQIENLSVSTGKIAADAVTYAKMQNVSATDRFLGRKTAGAGDVEELTGTEATARLDAVTSALKGLAPASGGGTSNFLRADISWAAPPGGSGPTTTYKGNTQSATSSANTVDVTGLTFAVTAGSTYSFYFRILFGSSVTTTGLRLAMTFPLAKSWGCMVAIPIAANGTAGSFDGQILVTGGSVTATAAAAVNTQYLATIDGIIGVSTTGTLSVQFGSEINGTTVTIHKGSLGVLQTI